MTTFKKFTKSVLDERNAFMEAFALRAIEIVATQVVAEGEPVEHGNGFVSNKLQYDIAVELLSKLKKGI